MEAIPNQTSQLQAPSKDKTSSFMITFNPNISCKKVPDQVVRERIKSTIQTVFSNKSLAKLVKFKDYKHSFTKKYIKGVNMEYALEKGSKCGFTHAHILLKITHRSSVQLKIRELKEEIRYQMNFPSMGLDEERKFYLNVRFVRDNNASVRYYLEKEMRQQPNEPNPPNIPLKEGEVAYV